MIHRSQVLSHDSLTTTKGGTITTVLLAKELSLRDAHELQGEPLLARGRVTGPSAGPRAYLCEGAGPHAPLSGAGGGAALYDRGTPGRRPGHTPVCGCWRWGGGCRGPPGGAFWGSRTSPAAAQRPMDVHLLPMS